jgi:LmbE family N-acetylglucosaminyl deacetylase
LLLTLAHPDDESFGLGGTLALYAKRGVEIHFVCGTRGEAGTVSPEFMQGYETVAQLREAELQCAAETLGLAAVRFLGYRDSGMVGTADNEHPEALEQAQLDQVIAALVGHIRRIKPQVVVTHDPSGTYGHPDHIKMHQATLEAFDAAGDPDRYSESGDPFAPQRLYYSTFSLSYLRLIISAARLAGRDPTRWGRNQDIDLTALTNNRFPTHVKVNYRQVTKTKRRAIACHASQLDMGPSMRGLIGLVFRLNRMRTVDTFMQAHPPVESRRVERDLFSGVELASAT